jgi:hypothetical protein
MSRNPELAPHIEWLGYLQPVGLVVSPPALADAQVFPSKNIIPNHTRFLDLVEQVTVTGERDPRPAIREFPRFATQILGWEPADVVGTPESGACSRFTGGDTHRVQRDTSAYLRRPRIL